jgi:hypothetical protein
MLRIGCSTGEPVPNGPRPRTNVCGPTCPAIVNVACIASHRPQMALKPGVHHG